MAGAFDPALKAGEVDMLLGELRGEYELQQRGFRLTEIAGGYQLVTDARFESQLKRFYQTRLKRRLSQATLETLSIIAYRQPVTRADIEFIRGVNVDGALRTLLEKDLVKIAGKKDVPGRPLLYGTTKTFLEHFGLNAVDELPPLSQFTEKDIQDQLVPAEMSPALDEARDSIKQGRGEAFEDPSEESRKEDAL
jgi:segregation and condensation protein B